MFNIYFIKEVLIVLLLDFFKCYKKLLQKIDFLYFKLKKCKQNDKLF